MNAERNELVITSEKRGGYLHVRAAGAYSLAEAHRLTSFILDGARDCGLPAVFVDVRKITGEMSAMDRFLFAKAFAQKYLALVANGYAPVRFAFFGFEPLLDPNRLGETVAKNRGLSAIGTIDLQEASRFLGVDLEADHV